MTVSTRAAVLVLTIGFLAEGIGEAYEFASKTWLSGGILWLYYLGPATTGIGFILAFVGRHEWSEQHRKHVLHAHRALAAAIALLVGVGAAILFLSVNYATAALPADLPWILGALAAIGLASTFVSYLLIGYHITSRLGKAMLLLALLWAVIISLLAGYYVAANLGNIVSILHGDPLSLTHIVTALNFVTTVLFVSYFLLVIAFHDAYRQLLKGELPSGQTPAVRPSSPPGAPPAPPAPRSTSP